jgi:prolyl oligopeptidase
VTCDRYRGKIIYRNYQATKRIVTVDFSNPNQIRLILLQRMFYHHQQVVAFANYMKDAVSVVKQYDYSGKMLREIHCQQ